MVWLENVSLPSATFAKFQPQSVDFLEITNPKALYPSTHYLAIVVFVHPCNLKLVRGFDYYRCVTVLLGYVICKSVLKQFCVNVSYLENT